MPPRKPDDQVAPSTIRTRRARELRQAARIAASVKNHTHATVIRHLLIAVQQADVLDWEPARAVLNTAATHPQLKNIPTEIAVCYLISEWIKSQACSLASEIDRQAAGRGED